MARRRSFSYKMRQYSPLAPYFITANIAFRRFVFDKIGVFDTRFVGGGDVDFSWRFLNEKHLNLQFNPNAIVFHRHRQNLKDFFSQHIRVGRGIAMLHNKYPNRLPWSFYKEISTWCSLLGLFLITIQKIIADKLYYNKSENKDRTKDNYFDLIRKTAVRLGFIWENLKIH